ncbi:MAG: transglutaminase domain-containing protein [Acetatifactor sp.]|nr:transglutaminase domain-containing protein [Acetatifactor sp.]
MNRLHFHEKALYRAANGAILACIGLFLPFFGIDTVTWKNILVLAVVLALLVGISILSARGKVLCLLFSAICLCVPSAVAGWRTSYLFLQAYFQWCGGYGGTQEQWLEAFRLIHTMVITAAAFLVQILLEKFKALKIGLAFVFADGMLFCLIARISLTHMSVVFMLLYIVAVYVEWLQEHWKKARSGGLKAQMLWLSPFLCVYLLLMAVMPAPETPYDWQWAKNLYSQVKESFLVVSQNLFHGNREDFSTALSGFSDDGELGDGVQDDDREVMKIQAQRSLMTNLYLIGKVYDTFDGRQWLQEDGDDGEERFIDAMETLYAVRRLDDKYLTDYLRMADIRIRYEVFNTEYVFAPLKARNIQGSAYVLDYSFEGGDIVFESRKGYGTEYNVEYYQMNIGEELFEQLLETPKEPDEALWGTIAMEYEKQTGQNVTLELVESHRQMIYENYLEEITLSQEVESYLDEITGDAMTNLERLQAIERELNSYTYNRKPGSLPDDVTNASEFLDYFLLESREGYCTYFATAFVLLARAEGIPARYVQGFCVPMQGSQEAAVLSSMAHSWPEVYIEDVGWIPFEPTPGYEKLRYTPWGVSMRDSSSVSEAGEGDENEWEGILTGMEEELEADGESESQEPEEALGFERLLRVLIFGIPTILAGFALVLLVDNWLGMYRYRRMDLTEKLKVEVRQNFRVLSWLGLKREDQETLQELRDRGTMVLGLTTPLRFIEDYEDVLYGGKKVEEEALERIKREREQLLELIREEKKLMNVFYRMRMFLVRYR